MPNNIENIFIITTVLTETEAKRLRINILYRYILADVRSVHSISTGKLFSFRPRKTPVTNVLFYAVFILLNIMK